MYKKESKEENNKKYSLKKRNEEEHISKKYIQIKQLFHKLHKKDWTGNVM